MRCFDYNLLKNLSFKSDIVKLIANIYALKSLQNKYTSAKSNTLDKLVEIAKIQSTEASNYIEALKVSDQNWHQGQNDPKPFINKRT